LTLVQPNLALSLTVISLFHICLHPNVWCSVCTLYDAVYVHFTMQCMYTVWCSACTLYDLVYVHCMMQCLYTVWFCVCTLMIGCMYTVWCSVNTLYDSVYVQCTLYDAVYVCLKTKECTRVGSSWVELVPVLFCN